MIRSKVVYVKQRTIKFIIENAIWNVKLALLRNVVSAQELTEHEISPNLKVVSVVNSSYDV